MPDKVLTMRDVLDITQKSRTTIYSWIKKGDFPKQRNLGANSIGWWESDIAKWKKQVNDKG